MASFHKPVAEIIPGMMALGLMGSSAKMADRALKGEAKEGDFLKTAVGVLVGVPLTGAVATQVAAL